MRILLVTHIRLLCDVLAEVLEEESDMQVTGCATSLDEVLDQAHQADVILISNRMSDGTALDLIRAIVRAGLPLKVIALGLSDSQEQVDEYIQAGAAGYVFKDDSLDDLIASIRNI